MHSWELIDIFCQKENYVFINRSECCHNYGQMSIQCGQGHSEIVSTDGKNVVLHLCCEMGTTFLWVAISTGLFRKGDEVIAFHFYFVSRMRFDISTCTLLLCHQ